MVASNQIFPRPGAGSVGKLRGSDSHESHLPYCHALSIKEPLRRLLSEPQRRGEVTKKLPNRQQQASDMQFLSGWSSHGRITARSYDYIDTMPPDRENAEIGVKISFLVILISL